MGTKAGLRDAGPQVIEWGVAAMPLPGQSVCGDRHVVALFPVGGLVGVVDGLGHGPEAAAAAEVAVAILERSAQEPVTSLVRRCHQALERTRGVVMTLASLNVPDGTLTWLGVGNAEGVLFRADSNASLPRESVSLRGGVVGYQVPPLRAQVVRLAPDDVLVFTTDGIRSEFDRDLRLADPPQRMADQVLARHARGTDDALVLVVRYLGGAP